MRGLRAGVACRLPVLRSLWQHSRQLGTNCSSFHTSQVTYERSLGKRKQIGLILPFPLSTPSPFGPLLARFISIPRFHCYSIGIVSEEILLKDWIRPPVGIPFERFAISHLSVSFPLRLAIRKMHESSIRGALSNDPTRSTLSQPFVDLQSVLDLLLVLRFRDERA